MLPYLPIIGTVSGVVLGALLTWLATRYHRKQQVAEENTAIATIVSAELSRISNHFSISLSELRASKAISHHEHLASLRLSSYGPIRSLEIGLLRLGFLGGDILAQLMELGFLIRNNDTELDAMRTALEGSSLGEMRQGAIEYDRGLTPSRWEQRAEDIICAANSTRSQIEERFTTQHKRRNESRGMKLDRQDRQ